MNRLLRNTFMAGKFNNYLVGGNLCNALALGDVGSSDDFFLIASEPADESIYPMITANVLDSDGKVLFRIVKNVLILNPGNCSKILGNHLGYEIHDSAGNLILGIATTFRSTDQTVGDTFVTTITANFYDKLGNLVFRATDASEQEQIEASCKAAFGFSGGFGLVQNYSHDELEAVRVALLTNGSVHQKLSGSISNAQLNLEGKFFQNATISGCKVLVTEGDFVIGKNTSFSGCEFFFEGRARKIFDLAKALLSSK